MHHKSVVSVTEKWRAPQRRFSLARSPWVKVSSESRCHATSHIVHCMTGQHTTWCVWTNSLQSRSLVTMIYPLLGYLFHDCQDWKCKIHWHCSNPCSLGNTKEPLTLALLKANQLCCFFQYRKSSVSKFSISWLWSFSVYLLQGKSIYWLLSNMRGLSYNMNCFGGTCSHLSEHGCQYPEVWLKETHSLKEI